jgi:signal transduction histidine kinase
MDKFHVSLLQQRWVRWVCYFGFWTFLGLTNVSQSYVIRQSKGIPFNLLDALILGLADWYLWAAFTPLVYFLARRFRFDQKTWAVSLGVHVVVNLLITVLIAAALTPVYQACALDPTEEVVPYEKLFRLLFAAEVISYFWVYWAILGVCYAVDYYRKFRERELKASQLETQLAQAQLLVLKMQLHPHFLFNTLHAVSALMHQNVQMADTMLARLGELLRSTLDNVGTQEVTLQQELDFIRPYLEIEQARLGPRLKVQMDVEPEALDAYVPNFILQPLVENAIRHGISPRPGPGCITIRAERRGGQLALEVRDNGPGLGPSPRPGVGLSNTRARLQHLYGDAHQFDLRNAPDGGAVAAMAVPFREMTLAEPDALEEGALPLLAREPVLAGR